MYKESGKFMTKDENILSGFIEILDSKESNENTIQKFLEEHSEFLYLPVLLNHGLHFNCVISKFKLNNEYVTDFAYLTKSSDHWKFVLIELESSNKKIFVDKTGEPKFSSEFNNAYDQITNWKAYIEQNKDSVLHKIDKICVPLNNNNVRFEYCLIIGRSEEKENNEKRRALFSQKSREDMHVMTYDSIIHHYDLAYDIREKIILSPVGDQGFKIKILPQEVSTSIFAYVLPEFLSVNKSHILKLKEQGYDMDVWLKGKLLAVNFKQTHVKLGSKTFYF